MLERFKCFNVNFSLLKTIYVHLLVCYLNTGPFSNFGDCVFICFFLFLFLIVVMFVREILKKSSVTAPNSMPAFPVIPLELITIIIIIIIY